MLFHWCTNLILHTKFTFVQIMTVTAFKRMVHEDSGIKPEHQHLILVGKPLKDEDKLGDYPIRNGSTIFLSLRLLGGTTAQKLEKGYQEQLERLRKFPANAPKCDEECMICLGPPSIRMPCKHAICPTHLMNHAWTEVSCNGRYEVCCPLCSSEWPVSIIWKYGNATKMEMDDLELGISENYIDAQPGIRNCPKCNTYCERLDPSSNRVRCQVCCMAGKGVDFCWHCFKSWNNSQSTLQCGNDQCDSVSLLTFLREAPLVTPQGFRKKVPSKRACPYCGIIIELKGGCKQMKCAKCKTDFCFACLKKKFDGSWQCVGSSTDCEVAPVQERIPGQFRS